MIACAVCGIDGFHACPGPTPIDNSGFNLVDFQFHKDARDYPLLGKLVKQAIREYKAGKTKPL